MSDDEQLRLSGSENELSDESDNFKEIISIYQKEMKSKRSQKQPKLPKEISHLMGEANQLFMFSKFQEATQKLYEIIRQYPNFPEPYHLLGLICEEKQQLKKAAHFFSLAAELSQNDGDLWQKIGFLYKKSKCYEQASYCFARALKSDPLNSRIIIERASCLEIIGDLKNAIKLIEKVLTFQSDNINLVKKCAKLYAKNKQTNKSMELLQPFIMLEVGTIDFNILHMICELYVLDGEYKECSDIIEKYIKNIDSNSIQQLPPELITIYGTSNAQIGNFEKTNLAFQALQQQDCETYSDLFLQAIQVLEKIGNYEQCLEIYEKLMTLPEFDNEYTWLKAGILYSKINDIDSAIDAFKTVIEHNPQIYEAKVQLSNIYYKLGKIEEALNTLDNEPLCNKNRNIKNEEDNDEIFYSDDDQKEQEKIFQSEETKVKFSFRDNLSKKIKQEQEIHIPQIEQKIKFKDDFEPEIETKGFSETIDDQIKLIQQKYDINQIRLNLKQADILLESEQESIFIEKTFDNLIKALKLEIAYTKIKSKVLNRYLYESRKRTFKKAIKSKNILKNIDQNKHSLILTSKKQKDSDEFLMKKKTKLSKVLTEKHLENIQYISKIEGKDKIIFYIQKYLQILTEQKDYKRISKLTWKSYQLEYLVEFVNVHLDVLYMGVYSSCMVKDFTKAFQYIRYFIRKRPDSQFLNTVFSRIIDNLSGNMIIRTFISKLSQKLNKNQQLYLILGQGYLQHSFYELAVKHLYYLYETDNSNTLVNLLIAVSLLQTAISRTTKNRNEYVKRAFYHFDQYFQIRQQADKVECMYNIGRAYAQVSMYNDAIEHFEKCILQFQQNLLQKKENKNDKNLFQKAVYNMIVIHKTLGNKLIASQLAQTYLNLDNNKQT